MVDRFGKIDYVLKHDFNVRNKILPQVCKKSSIGNFRETAEGAEFLVNGKKEKQRIGRNRKKF